MMLSLVESRKPPPVQAALVVTYLQFPIQVCFPCSASPSVTDPASVTDTHFRVFIVVVIQQQTKLECGPMPNVMVALPNIGGALCSTPQSLVDAHY